MAARIKPLEIFVKNEVLEETLEKEIINKHANRRVLIEIRFETALFILKFVLNGSQLVKLTIFVPAYALPASIRLENATQNVYLYVLLLLMSTCILLLLLNAIR